MRLISLVQGDLRVIKLLNTFQKQIGKHLINSDFSDLEFIHLSNLSNWQYILQINNVSGSPGDTAGAEEIVQWL